MSKCEDDRAHERDAKIAAESKSWTKPPQRAEANDLHEMRCLLYESGWDSVGSPVDALRRLIQTCDAAIRERDRCNNERHEAEERRMETVAAHMLQRAEAEKAEAEAQALREQLAELQADLPHCSRCGAVLNCDGTDKEHQSALRARVEKLKGALRDLTWNKRGDELIAWPTRERVEALLSESEQGK